MEHFGQDYGYILYRTTVTGPRKGPLYLGDVRDVAHVYLDQTPVGSVERRQQVSTAVDIPAGHHTLDVLVENSGRINYGPRMADGRAGLVDPVLLGNQQVTGWQAFPLPMRAPDSIRGWTRKAVQGPAFHRGTVRIGTPADTYLDMRASARASPGPTASTSAATGTSAHKPRCISQRRSSARVTTRWWSST